MSARTFYYYVEPDKQNQDCNKITDLKLSGNKVKLGVRPLGKSGRASSRYALLGPNSNRPVSALPLLDLCQYDDFEINNAKKRRPFSADCIDYYCDKIDRNQSVRRDNSEENSTSLDEKTLPSSNLLQNLLREPIKSWRGEQGDYFEDDHEIYSQVDNNRDTRREEINLEKESTMVDLEKFSNKSTDLVPGLKTKPPLPKKPDLNQIDQSKKNRAKNCAETKRIEEEFENDTFCKEKHKSASNSDNKIKQKRVDFDFENTLINNETCYNERRNVENVEKHEVTLWSLENVKEVSDELSRNISNEMPELFTDDFDETQNGSINKDLMVQNWIFGEKSLKYEIVDNTKNAKKLEDALPIKDIETEVFLKEQKTDESIQRYRRKSHEEINETDSSKRDLQTEDENFDERFKKFFNIEQKTLKQPPKLKMTKDLNKKRTKVETTKSKTPKIGGGDNEKTIKKGFFFSKHIKSHTDYQQKTHPDEVTSWMSQNGENEKETKRSNVDYLDVLKNLEQIEELSKENVTDDTVIENEVVPEQDSDKGYETNTDNGTYDEIVSILEVLEAEDKRSQMKVDSIKDILNLELSEKRGREDTPESGQNGDSVRNLLNGGGNDKSSTNFNHLLQFLDEVDRNCNKTIERAQERVQKVTEVLEATFSFDAIPKMADLMSYTNSELAQQVIDLSLRVKDKSSSIALLQKELSVLREQMVKANKKTEQIVKEKLKVQREEYESTVKRHQKFIDQLMADKKSLNEQCEGFVREMKILEERYASNMKALEHRHQVELQKAKEMCVAGEKIRRERWMDNKTQKIKDLTVKSIAPELEKMERRQQQELADLRALHKREIEDMELKAARKTQQQLENLRHQMIEEREKTLSHEREIMRVRYEKLVESEEKAYQEQRRRLMSEISKRQKEYEERAAMLEEEKTKAIEHAKQEAEEKLESLMRRHNNELKLMKETSEIEMETYRNNLKKQQAIESAQKEASIKEHYRKERDREIEAIIERLEAESNENKLQIESSAENRIKRIREKFENELRELELSEKEAKNKYAEAKTKLAETEEVVISLRASIRQLQTQLDESRKVSKSLIEERAKIKETLKRETSKEMETLERDVATMKSEHERELQQVYARVKVSVARKDEVISELSGELKATKEKCAFLENMLEQQRKEYLMK